MARRDLPEPPEVQEIIELSPGTPYVFQRGIGPHVIDTKHGDREVFGAHVFDHSGYLGHVNVFWTAVRAQLGETLVESDDLVGGIIVRVPQSGSGQDRYELRAYDGIAAMYDLAESLLIKNGQDTPEDAPFTDEKV